MTSKRNSDSGRDNSAITFLHESMNVNIANGKKITNEENIYFGSKGLTMKFYHKEDDKTEKVVVVAKGDDKFLFKTNMNGDIKEEELSKSEVLKKLDSKKHKFMIEFLKDSKNLKRMSRTLKGGAKKASKKGSKKGSRKMSRKGSKKGSKKGSRKMSRKGSKKGSKKMARKIVC